MWSNSLQCCFQFVSVKHMTLHTKRSREKQLHFSVRVMCRFQFYRNLLILFKIFVFNIHFWCERAFMRPIIRLQGTNSKKGKQKVYICVKFVFVLQAQCSVGHSRWTCHVTVEKTHGELSHNGMTFNTNKVYIANTYFITTFSMCSRTSSQNICFTQQASPTYVSRIKDASPSIYRRSTLNLWLTVRVGNWKLCHFLKELFIRK